MNRVIFATIALIFLGLTLDGKDTPLNLPKDATPEQEHEYWHQLTERRQHNLVIELEEIAAQDPQVTLYTTQTEPNTSWIQEGKTEWVDVFREYPIIGKAEVTNREDRNALLQALIRGIRESDGATVMCFEPRHALTISTKEKRIDILVCFECLQGGVWGAYSAKGFVTTHAPAIVFNKIAATYKLPVAK
jgi:hypothetical protein